MNKRPKVGAPFSGGALGLDGGEQVQHTRASCNRPVTREMA